MAPDNVDKLTEELGIEVMTPEAFLLERSRLEKQFFMDYAIHAHEIDAAVRSGELHHAPLVQDWIDLLSLEPYILPRKERRPPRKRLDEAQREGRDSGLFSFRRIARAVMHAPIIGAWIRPTRNSCSNASPATCGCGLPP